jgi:hypothetical protein
MTTDHRTQHDARVVLLEMPPVALIEDPFVRGALAGGVVVPILLALGGGAARFPALVLGGFVFACTFGAAYARVRLVVSLVREAGHRAVVVERTSIFGTRAVRIETQETPVLVLDDDVGFSYAREPVRMRVFLRIPGAPTEQLETVTSREREARYRDVAEPFARAALRSPGAVALDEAAREERKRRDEAARMQRAKWFAELEDATAHDDVSGLVRLLGRGLGVDDRHVDDSPLELAAVRGGVPHGR